MSDTPDGSTAERATQEEREGSTLTVSESRLRHETARESTHGRFRLEREIGRGATGTVFRATDVDRHLPVALKVLHSVGSKQLVAFKAEFRIAASVSHPNLITPFELSSGEHGWCIAMELVEGVDFLEHVRPENGPTTVGDPPFDQARLRNALLDVLNGLEALHGSGYLHRDLKPSNVLVGADGRARIADLGLATLKEVAAAGEVMPRTVVGTPGYMAPEQARGTVLTPAADLYALGAMCFEALTGVLPFEGSVHAVMAGKTQRDAPDPRGLVDGLPNDLAGLTVALLARDPRERPSVAVIRKWLRAGAVDLAPRSIPVLSREIVGRARELRELEDAVAAVARGETSVVHVRGTSGVGKSALLRAFCARARDQMGAWVLAGRCHELESIPRKGFDDAMDVLHERLTALTLEERAALLPASLIHALPLFPTLTDLMPNRAPVPRDRHTAGEQTLQAHDALVDLIAAVAAKKVVVFVLDDVQWSDQDGARLLDDLLASAPRLPAVFVLAYRSDEAQSGAMLRALAQRTPGPRAYTEHIIDVLPLGPVECMELALKLLSHQDSALAERIVTESQGDPFLIEQLSLHGTADLDPGGEIDDVIVARSAALPEQARELLDTIVVAGQPIAERLAALATGQPDLRALLTNLTAISLLRRTGSGPDALVYPYHDRVRVALWRRVSEPRRTAIHLALANHGEREHLLPPRALCDQLAKAGQFGRAAEQALLAAADAEAVLAFDAAVESYDRAIEYQQARPDLMSAAQVGRAHALFHAGRCAEAGDAYVLAAEVAAPTDRDNLKLRAVEALLASGRVSRALQELEPLLAATGARYPHRTRDVVWGLARGAVLTRVHCRRRPVITRDVDVAHAQRSDVLWAAGKGFLPVSPGHGAVLAYHALLEAVRSRDALRIARGLAFVGSGAAPFVEGVSAQYLEWANDIADQLNDDHLRVMVLVAETARATAAGNWSRAIDAAQRALALAPAVRAPTAWEESTAHSLLVTAYEYQGELNQMARASEACLRESRARGDAFTEVTVMSALGYAQAAAHEAAEVDAAITAMRTNIERWSLAFGMWDFYRARLEVLRALCWGQVDEAATIVNTVWPELERSHLLQMPFVRGPALTLRSAVIHEQLALDRSSRTLANSARKNADLMRREARADGPVNALLSDAALAHAKAQPAQRDALLVRATEASKAADLRGSTRLSTYALARFNHDDANIARLESELRSHGVADVMAWARYVTPGLSNH